MQQELLRVGARLITFRPQGPNTGAVELYYAYPAEGSECRQYCVVLERLPENVDIVFERKVERRIRELGPNHEALRRGGFFRDFPEVQRIQLQELSEKPNKITVDIEYNTFKGLPSVTKRWDFPKDRHPTYNDLPLPYDSPPEPYEEVALKDPPPNPSTFSAVLQALQTPEAQKIIEGIVRRQFESVTVEAVMTEIPQDRVNWAHEAQKYRRALQALQAQYDKLESWYKERLQRLEELGRKYDDQGKELTELKRRLKSLLEGVKA